MSAEEVDRLIASRAEELGSRLRARGWTLATAESCTGGGLSDAITDVAGSSDYFKGGVVSYSNAVKESLLGVDPAVLAAEGAVSETVAAQMAEGARRAIGADVGVGITGVAGPGGGSDEKAVGLVFISVAEPDGTEVRRFRWDGDRVANKRQSVAAALEMLIELT
jgi:PncC family amidohydrolase